MAELPLRVLLLIVSVALPVKVTVVVDAAAVLVGRVAAEGAVVDRKRCAAEVDTVVEDTAAAVSGRVAAEGAMVDRKRCVPAEGAVVYRQRRMILEDATARVIGISPTAGATVSDGEAGNGDGFTGRNVKHAARGVAVHC